MARDNCLGNRQPESGPFDILLRMAAIRFRPIEAFKDMWQYLWIDPRPRIVYGHDYSSTLGPDGYVDRLTSWRKA